jgi:hypothetical protein
MERCMGEHGAVFILGFFMGSSTVYYLLSSRTRLRDMARNGCLVRSRGL